MALYIDVIVLIWSSEQEAATSLDFLVRRSRIRGWEINPIKIQGPSTTVKFLQALNGFMKKKKKEVPMMAGVEVHTGSAT